MIHAKLQGKVYYEGIVEQNVYLNVERSRCLTLGKSSSHVFLSLRSYEKDGKIRASQIALTSESAGGLKRIALKVNWCIKRVKFEENVMLGCLKQYKPRENRTTMTSKSTDEPAVQ